ncbi:MAG TPA: MazG family protein [Acidimicrobiia bacterium]|nr:MazG family protein [Acidimicrobiia bacterium]
MTQDQAGFEDLVELVATLRNPDGGCPWDIEQTHESLAKYLQEETQEVLEVLETFKDSSSEGDYASLKDELGDVLLQVLLHSQLASESGKFTIVDVLENLSQKLIRRHPHVFGDSEASTIEDVEAQWQKIKQEEKETKD